MTSSYSEKITKLKNALENVFVKKTDIKNNLTSTDTNKPLSANQGKILDTNKVDKISGKSLSTNDFTNTYKTKLDNLDTLLENKANNTHTHGNLQNDGSIGTSNNVNKNVITDGNGKITTEDKPTIPSASSTIPSADTSSGSYGSGTTYARANHQHPKSSLYAETSHTHTKSEITDFTHTHSISDVTTLQTNLNNKVNTSDIVTNLTTDNDNKVLSAKQGKLLQDNKLNKKQTSYKGKNVVVDNNSGEITFEDKPTIPKAGTIVPFSDSKDGSAGNSDKWAKADHIHRKSNLYAESDHNHDNTYIKLSNTTGLVKNDGSIDTTSYLSSLPSHTHDTATLETDGFLSMQDKAKLDNLSYDSGWQEVTFKSGYTRYNDSVSVYVRRKGDFVELVGVWKTTSKKSATSTPTAFASIPSEFTPSKAINTVCFGRGQNTYMLTVDNNGTLSWSRYGKTTTIDLERGDFGNVHCIWMI